ncbi:thrombospondin type 3 repeat-containing protein [Patescibacteria group bacterium]|nr:thrombospondin type 3 repeat-containing protein [Patescibacteria group bacterium]
MTAKQNRQVEDIFSEVDKGKGTTPRKSVAVRPAAAPQSPLADKPKKRFRTPIIFLIIFIVIIVLGLAVMLVYSLWYNNDSDNENTNQVNSVTSVAPTNSASVDNSDIILQPITNETIDEDGDGLTDEEEKDLKTNPRSLDSDKDGLYDREEVRVYQTDPLKADSDGDGNMDGTEVANGFNPSGSGLLLNLEEEIKKLN